MVQRSMKKVTIHLPAEVLNRIEGCRRDAFWKYLPLTAKLATLIEERIDSLASTGSAVSSADIYIDDVKKEKEEDEFSSNDASQSDGIIYGDYEEF
jgi:hypothetical protein